MTTAGQKFPGLIGKKHGMTQVFNAEGQALPVTVIELLPLTITQIKTQAHDGYDAVQVGYGPAKEKHLTKAEQGHFKKQQQPLFRHLKEFRVPAERLADLKVGDTIDPFGETSLLAENIKLDVIGRSIGKGFQGNTRRWHHHRGPMSHGSKSHRLPGSIGAGTTPGRVFKGLRMAGHLGDDRTTIKNLSVVKVLADKKAVLLHGAVPGVEGGLLTLRLSGFNNPGAKKVKK